MAAAKAPNPPRECSDKGCSRTARAAVKTARAANRNVVVTLYADDRLAPKSATPYCNQHTAELLPGLVAVLVDLDEDSE